MQYRHLCCPPTFSLAPQFYTHFFNYRLATDCQLRCCGAEYILLSGFNVV